jgi:hypothetical protein
MQIRSVAAHAAKAGLNCYVCVPDGDCVMIVNNFQWTEASARRHGALLEDSLDRTLETGVL